MKPIEFHWDGESMVPTERLRKLCDEQYVIGENYTLNEEHPRSGRSHDHQFAEVAEYWKHLREDVQAELPTPDHLRKHALCCTGWCKIEKLVLSTRQEAVAVAAFAKPRSDKAEDYVVIDVAGNVVTRYTPMSQSKKAMGAKAFQASKDDVLEYCKNLVGGTLEQLREDKRRLQDHQGERVTS